MWVRDIEEKDREGERERESVYVCVCVCGTVEKVLNMSNGESPL